MKVCSTRFKFLCVVVLVVMSPALVQAGLLSCLTGLRPPKIVPELLPDPKDEGDLRPAVPVKKPDRFGVMLSARVDGSSASSVSVAERSSSHGPAAASGKAGRRRPRLTIEIPPYEEAEEWVGVPQGAAGFEAAISPASLRIRNFFFPSVEPGGSVVLLSPEDYLNYWCQTREKLLVFREYILAFRRAHTALIDNRVCVTPGDLQSSVDVYNEAREIYDACVDLAAALNLGSVSIPVGRGGLRWRLPTDPRPLVRLGLGSCARCGAALTVEPSCPDDACGMTLVLPNNVSQFKEYGRACDALVGLHDECVECIACLSQWVMYMKTLSAQSL